MDMMKLGSMAFGSRPPLVSYALSKVGKRCF
jgi:hypothetical protein